MSDINELRAVLDDFEHVVSMHLEPATHMLLRTLAEGGKILTCGNGGSAAQALHMSAELTVRFVADRRALASVCLNADPVALTACGNDYAFDRVFARQVEALGQPGDCLVAFSTSGRSMNCNEALTAAHRKGMQTLGISGRKGFAAHCDQDIIVPSQSTARIQEVHLLLVHLLIAGIERGVPK